MKKPQFTRFFTTEYPKMLDRSCLLGTVLDLGAGDGEIIYGLMQAGKLKHVTKVLAVDIASDRIELLKQELKDVPFSLSAAWCSAENLSHIPDNSVDFIICNQVIEHVERPEKLIAEAHRVLKFWGGMYLSTVYKKPFNFGYYRNKYDERTLDPTHLREYTSSMELMRLLDKKFTVIEQTRKLQWFSVTDFILPRIGLMGHIYERNFILKILRNFRLPIIGYFNWELYCGKHRA